MNKSNDPNQGKPQYMTPMVCLMCIVFILALLLPYMVKRAVVKPEVLHEPVVEQVAVEPVQAQPQVVVETNTAVIASTDEVAVAPVHTNNTLVLGFDNFKLEFKK